MQRLREALTPAEAHLTGTSRYSAPVSRTLLQLRKPEGCIYLTNLVLYLAFPSL